MRMSKNRSALRGHFKDGSPCTPAGYLERLSFVSTRNAPTGDQRQLIRPGTAPRGYLLIKTYWHFSFLKSFESNSFSTVADITAKTNGEEQTPLHYAARYDSVEAMKVLIQAGAMIDGVDFLNRTPLHVAAETGKILYRL